jgi:very-short-patch-repair endonuclease
MMPSKKSHIDFSSLYSGASTIVMNRAKALRQRMTSAENLLWEELRLKKLGAKFRRQHPIDKYIVDFYCHQLRLSIEIDGGYHLTERQEELDLKRTQRLQQLGLLELRFSNNEVEHNINQVLSIIKDRIKELQK